jgi:hypothetical protein
MFSIFIVIGALIDGILPKSAERGLLSLHPKTPQTFNIDCIEIARNASILALRV